MIGLRCPFNARSEPIVHAVEIINENISFGEKLELINIIFSARLLMAKPKMTLKMGFIFPDGSFWTNHSWFLHNFICCDDCSFNDSDNTSGYTLIVRRIFW